VDRVASTAYTIVGIGVDIAGIPRVTRFLLEHASQLERVFTPQERAFCEAGAGRRRSVRYAAAFAAKEAVMKALGTGWRSDVPWSDVDTATRENHGGVVLSGGARTVAEHHGVTRILISVTTTADAAVATAVAEGHE
jgi:holo-[acyl-carrier protein] synthase